jgi:hypothetical protein
LDYKKDDMTLTSLIRIIFRDKNVYKNVSHEDKKKHFFMLNKIMSRIYPTSANALNINGIDPAICVDIWFDNLSKQINIPNRLEPQYHLLNKNKARIDISEDDLYILKKYYSDSLVDISLEKSENVVVVKKLKKTKK